MVGRGWKIALLLNSSNFCRALLALLPSSYSIPAAGRALRIFGDLSGLQKKNWKTDGERQNHSADASAHLVLGSLAPWLAGWIGCCAVQVRRYGGCSRIRSTLIRCSVPSNTQSRDRQGQLQAPLMICLEPSSLSLGNLEIRHGAAPGASKCGQADSFGVAGVQASQTRRGEDPPASDVMC